jgi:uncharacterized membrane protein YdjX (TVP38/TMEM64 family)
MPETHDTAPQGAGDTPGRSRAAALKGLALIALVAAGVVLFKIMDLEHVMNAGWVETEITSRGLAGWFWFVGVFGLFMALGLPRQLPSLLAGFAFGVALGTVLTLAGSGLGCAVSFLYARHLGKDFVMSRFEQRIRKVNALFSRHPFAAAVAIRFMPVGNNLVTNLLAGVSDAPLLPYLAGSMLGYIPQTFVFALLGSGVKVDPLVRISLAALLFVLASWLGYRLYLRFRALAAEEGQELPEA